MDKKDWIEWLSSFSIHYITSYINLGDHSLFSKFIRHKKTTETTSDLQPSETCVTCLAK